MERDTTDRNSFDDSRAFSGYRWTYYESLPEGPIRSRAEDFLASVRWNSLLQYASERRDAKSCHLLPPIGLGYNHMVRIIEFDDRVRWAARLRLPPLGIPGSAETLEHSMESVESCEYNTISLVRQKTNVPIPKAYALEARGNTDVNASFMLMECLPGNVGIDLGMTIPPKYMQGFLRHIAQIHVQLSTVQMPMIGTIISRNEDGTYEQGPIPGIGGPFNTATEFFKAWAAKCRFGMPVDQLRNACGDYAHEIIPSVGTFPKSISSLADRLSTRDCGPFPICHGDFGHNNIIVDDEYRILGVIDWETAFAGPWEIFADFPLTLSMVPAAMDAPWNYDRGNPVSPELKQQLADQKTYVKAVKQAETEMGASNFFLSEALNNQNLQQLMTGMRLYQNGKVGWYSKLIECFA